MQCSEIVDVLRQNLTSPQKLGNQCLAYGSLAGSSNSSPLSFERKVGSHSRMISFREIHARTRGRSVTLRGSDDVSRTSAIPTGTLRTHTIQKSRIVEYGRTRIRNLLTQKKKERHQRSVGEPEKPGRSEHYCSSAIAGLHNDKQNRARMICVF